MLGALCYSISRPTTLPRMTVKKAFIALCAIALISTPMAQASEPLSQDTRMKLVKTLTGDLAPKSVLSSGTGLISAHNMMYKHTVTFFNSESMELVSTVKDSVDLKSFGFPLVLQHSSS